MALSANVELNNMRGHVEMHEWVMPQNGSSAGEFGAGHDGVLAQHHEGADSCSPLTSPAEETFGSARTGCKKPRKNRTGNWLENDTEQVIKIYAVCKKSRGGTKNGRKKPLWDRVASELKRKTRKEWAALECRRRVDPVMKAYNEIEDYCKKNNMEVSAFFKEYEAGSLTMNLATRMTEKRFNLIREKCPPKLRTEQGDGSLPIPCGRKKAATTGGKHALANSGARVCFLRKNAEMWKLMLSIDCHFTFKVLVGLGSLTEPLL